MSTPQPSIVGMVDDLGRPATIFTPPEVLRRDPNRWPTPAEFVTEWAQYTNDQRTALAERILRDAQDAERLNRALEQAEARVDQLTDELALVRDTLRLRSDAVNTVGATNDTLRATIARAQVLVECWASTPGSLITRGNAALALHSALDDQEPNA